MSINGLSIATGATSITATGGTQRVYTPDGQIVTNGIHVAAAAVTDFRVRPHISWKNKNPQKKASGDWTLGTRTIVSTEPWLDTTTGIVHYVTITTEVRWSPYIPAATIKDARYVHCQLQFDTDAENFNTSGDLS